MRFGFISGFTFGFEREAVRKRLSQGQIWCWGDSLTQGAGGVAWPSQAEALLPGYSFPNRGIGGQRSRQVAARMGSEPALLAVDRNEIPESGRVAILSISIDLLRTHVPARWNQFGTLADVPGILSRSEGGEYTFERSSAGHAIYCPPESPWFAGDGLATRTSAGCVIWVGRNDLPGGSVDAFDAVSSMVRYLQDDQRNILIIGVTDRGGGGERLGSPRHAEIKALNRVLAKAYGDAFLDIRRHLIDRGLADAGMAPTSQDLLDIANDNIPTSLRAGNGDLKHLNTAGYGVVAGRVVKHIKRHWFR